jgi:hypothetical protein
MREGCSRRDTDNLISAIANYKTEASTYKTKSGLEISTNKALVLETQSQIKALLASNDTLKEWIQKFKNIKSGIIIKENTIIKEVKVPFETLIPCDFKPFKANKIDRFFNFYSTISNTGLTIDSLNFPNEQRIVVGEKKTGFLGFRKQMSVEVNNTNPYIKTTNMSAFTYEPKKKWWEHPIINFGVGFGAGFVGGRLSNKK